MPHLRKAPKATLRLLLLTSLALASGVPATDSAFARAGTHGHVRKPAKAHRGGAACRRLGAPARHGCAAVSHHLRTGGTPSKPARKLKKTRSQPTVSTPSAPASAAPGGATIATVLASPCANTELQPEAGNIPLLRAAVLCLINRERAQNGVAPLRSSPKLEAAAEGHCTELIQDDYFAHVSPSGETPVDRIRTTGYIPSPEDGYVIGENLAWGTYELATPNAIVAAWIASPEHLANILEAQYVETGIGITAAVPSSLADGAPGATYAEEFGVIIF